MITLADMSMCRSDYMTGGNSILVNMMGEMCSRCSLLEHGNHWWYSPFGYKYNHLFQYALWINTIFNIAHKQDIGVFCYCYYSIKVSTYMHIYTRFTHCLNERADFLRPCLSFFLSLSALQLICPAVSFWCASQQAVMNTEWSHWLSLHWYGLQTFNDVASQWETAHSFLTALFSLFSNMTSQYSLSVCMDVCRNGKMH